MVLEDKGVNVNSSDMEPRANKSEQKWGGSGVCSLDIGACWSLFLLFFFLGGGLIDCILAWYHQVSLFHRCC